jgi:hypothetical protein
MMTAALAGDAVAPVLPPSLAGHGLDFGLSSPSTLLAMPIALEEMVFADWLIVKEFARPDAHLDRPSEVRVDAIA